MQWQIISLRLSICGVWSGSSLSANRIIGYYRMFQWRANARMRFCACAGRWESVHFARAKRHFFAWSGPYITGWNLEVAFPVLQHMFCFCYQQTAYSPFNIFQKVVFFNLALHSEEVNLQFPVMIKCKTICLNYWRTNIFILFIWL